MSIPVVLQSWKQIAKYVGRTERTVQRWELEFGFPVHRPSGKSRSSVMALAQEIEEWTRDKPSLVQIRKTARLNWPKPMRLPDRCIGVTPCAKELREQIKVERLRQAVLVNKQKQLTNQQRGLLALVLQKLEAGVTGHKKRW